MPAQGPNIPFLSDADADRLIDGSETINEQENWNRDYAENNYSNVLSVTACEKTLNRILKQLRISIERDEPMNRVCILGSGGPETALQRFLVVRFPMIDEIVCTDFSEAALALARGSFSHPKIVYVNQDMTTLAGIKEGEFDAVIVINSILSSNDILNRKALKSLYRVLRPAGLFLGLFPDILSTIELQNMSPDLGKKLHGLVNPYKNTLFENSQHSSQIFYSIQRLMLILREAGFTVNLDEIPRIPLDTSHFQQEYRDLYGFHDETLCIWENLVEIRK